VSHAMDDCRTRIALLTPTPPMLGVFAMETSTSGQRLFIVASYGEFWRRYHCSALLTTTPTAL